MMLLYLTLAFLAGIAVGFVLAALRDVWRYFHAKVHQ